MCGIFGLITKDVPGLTPAKLQHESSRLLVLSESRGKESAGLAILNEDFLRVLKRPVPASRLIRLPDYHKIFRDSFPTNGGIPQAVFGHSRLVTTGSQICHDNNQPVIQSGLVGVHNGIIVNDRELCQKYPDPQPRAGVDTAIFLSMLRMFFDQSGDMALACKQVFEEIEGSASVAVMCPEQEAVVLATNTGSLYMCVDPQQRVAVFASERLILSRFLKRSSFKSSFEDKDIQRILPGQGCRLPLDNLVKQMFNMRAPDPSAGDDLRASPRLILDLRPDEPGEKMPVAPEPSGCPAAAGFPEKKERRAVPLLRCSRCILPETFPFIDFDETGECNYCRHHQTIVPHGEAALRDLVEPFRKDNGEPDCIVALSGGRDSSYGLHYVKKVLKMNPLAYTYDWGMITDLARRNQARLCGKLGVEHLLVSADINQKRHFIRQNVLAWLKKPDLGMIPLFMAGDKQYFYYANRLSEQTGIKLTIFCNNSLETTRFKAGFSGINEGEDAWFDISVARKMRLAGYYARQFLSNPAYLNSSVPDTLAAFISSYFMKHDYISLFDYLPWDGEEMLSVLKERYDWEFAGDTKNSWRIGDGTASFYNYIYHHVAGFTENDTFRSHQVRDGLLSREEALRRVEEENRPRYDSIMWYCRTIGIDFEKTLRTIDRIAPLARSA